MKLYRIVFLVIACILALVALIAAGVIPVNAAPPTPEPQPVTLQGTVSNRGLGWVSYDFRARKYYGENGVRQWTDNLYLTFTWFINAQGQPVSVECTSGYSTWVNNFPDQNKWWNVGKFVFCFQGFDYDARGSNGNHLYRWGVDWEWEGFYCDAHYYNPGVVTCTWNRFQ